jgi:gliding motility-associated-like protein
LKRAAKISTTRLIGTDVKPSVQKERFQTTHRDFLTLFEYLLIIEYMRIILRALLFCLLAFPDGAFAQTVNYSTAQEAVNFLIGNANVQVSNVTFSGDPRQLGILSNFATPSFPYQSGVVLSTENAQGIIPGSVEDLADLNNGLSDDADLLEIANSVPPLIGQTFTVAEIHDEAVLEFDFVTQGSAISFDYVFASDEYLEFINQQYNDVFAFFISGPGISGPYQSPAGFPNGAINVAFVPNSNPELPITISSVNDGYNPEYYIDNSLEQDTLVALDGYTTSFTAYHSVICGETYHLRLAIADGYDGLLQSAVILKEGSFDVSSPIDVSTNIQVGSSGDPGANMIEGCSNAAFVLNIPCTFPEQEVTFDFSGNAELGFDYSFSGSLTQTLVPSTTINLAILPLFDQLVEGSETVTLHFTYLNDNGELVNANSSITIQDYVPATFTLNDVFLCPNEDFLVNIQPANGVGPFTVLWDDGNTDNPRTFSGAMPGQHHAVATDFCDRTSEEWFDITIPPAYAVADTVLICMGTLSDPIVEGGSMPYTFDLYPNFVARASDVTLGPIAYGNTLVTVTDNCGQSGTCYVMVRYCDTTIPNVFTPNGDDQNQYFYINGLDFFPGSSLTVWNRWGAVVLEDKYYNNRWDGKDAPDGTYFYEFLRSDGKIYKGTFELLSLKK